VQLQGRNSFNQSFDLHQQFSSFTTNNRSSSGHQSIRPHIFEQQQPQDSYSPTNQKQLQPQQIKRLKHHLAEPHDGFSYEQQE
jgi:hypothetical protein